MYLVPNHSKFGYYGTVFENDWKCQGLDYTAKNVPITYHWLSFPMHLHNELLQCTNDLTTLTDIMKLRKLWDIFYIHPKMKFKSHIYIEVPLKMAAGSSSPRRQNLLHGAKSTESTEPPAGCNTYFKTNIWGDFYCYAKTVNPCYQKKVYFYRPQTKFGAR